MSHIRFLIPVYALTLLVSAALLFSVQPLFSKMILPLLGGSPQVWNTAMVFFQVMLLAGYAYAHVINKILSVRMQAILHLVLLGVFLTFLPIALPDNIEPPETGNISFWQLGIMFSTIGGPFFILAGSAPLFQAWFARTDHEDADNPYFLYGASNFGSMSALLAYPFVIEPLMNLTQQTHIWMAGYLLLMALVLGAAAFVWNAKKDTEDQMDTDTEEKISWKMRGLWLALAFVPSSLMLGVTTFITTDVASVPLLWIIPLALYVGTFILAFARKPLIKHEKITLAHGLILVGLLCLMILFPIPGITMIFMHLLAFFIIALSCHTELSALKPSASKLTEFYLLLSVGGALGGAFNALLAPIIFNIPLEYPLALVLSCVLRGISNKKAEFSTFLDWLAFPFAFFSLYLIFIIPDPKIDSTLVLFVLACMAFVLERRWFFTIIVAIGLFLNMPGHQWGSGLYKETLHTSRNFFGVLRVIDTTEGYRILLHGTTNHGAQALDKDYEFTPLSYYSPFSPLSDIMELMKNYGDSDQNFAIMGLGSGVTACYTHEGRHFDFFEIDPTVIELAKDPHYFTFLTGCGSPYDVYLGDARLEMKKQNDAKYDLILADAFSSDNIPMHLITKEATELYLQKLKPDGILVFHISNNYLDLEPVLHETAKALNVTSLGRTSVPGMIEGTDIPYYGTVFVALSRNPDIIAALEEKGWSETMPRKGVKTWTDQFSNIISVLVPVTIKNRSRRERQEEKMMAEQPQ